MSGSAQNARVTPTFRGGRWLLAALLVVVLALLLAWTASGFQNVHFQNVQSWAPFLGMLLIGGLVLYLGWRFVQASEGETLPRWLAGLLVGAALLRLAAGALWFVALPTAGHKSPAELAGYVMADAYQRDQAAWKLAQSDNPLWSAFRNNRIADQYGGLLFVSALFYRYLGSGVVENGAPLLMLVLSAAFSALAVLFTWAFSRRAWGERVALAAAWILALYPEAVLLGSSQMREAFTMSLAAAAFYGLISYWQDRTLPGLLWILGALLLYLPFSPPFAAILLGMLVVVALVMSISQVGERIPHQYRLWLVLGVVALLVVVGLVFALSQFTPKQLSNPLALLSYWARKSAGLQAYTSKHASGWMQKIFKTTPDWMHLPLLLAYGVLQPFLPAALVATSQSPLWTIIQIWRAVGWTLLLAFLLYAPLRALREKDARGRDLALGLSLVVWLGIFVAAYRGGSDLWDTPRYRAAFAPLQAALVAWAWAAPRRVYDPWLRRSLVGIGFILTWFLFWYLRRYTEIAWPVSDLFKTLALGITCAVLFSIWDWARAAPARKT